MLWFLKDNDEDKRKKKRRRRSSSRSGDSGRPDPSDRGSRSRRSPTHRSRRPSSTEEEGRRDTRREDTRDRDERRKEKSRDRVVAKEQDEVFAAINFDGEPVVLDEVDRGFSRALTISLYVLGGLMVGALLVYAVAGGIQSRRAARVVPIQQAAAEGDLDTLRAQIARGAPINDAGPEGGTPLAAAIRAGQTEAVRMLLDGGAEASDSAMRLAMRHERWKMLEALVRAGGDPNVRGAWNGRSPLELATERRDMAMIRLLLERGADPSEVSHEGPNAQPALHYAAEHGMREVVDLLLAYGADPRKQWMGYRPRHLAEDHGHDELARILVEAEMGRYDPEVEGVDGK